MHGEVLDDVFAFVPELIRDEGPDVEGARLLLDLLLLRGNDWLLTAWLSGGLQPLWTPQKLQRRHAEELAAERARCEQLKTTLAQRNAQLEAIGKLRLWQLADNYWKARRAVARFFGRG